jgi:cytochrome c oxidase assembly protein subunit 15
MSTSSVGSLYNLAPLVQLLGLGLVIAMGPLLWVWMRNRQASPRRRLQALTLLTLFLTFDLVLFGSFTRLTDSGLGCPDWPGCYGHSSPVGAGKNIEAAQTAMPTGPVTHNKAWVEMVHRYLATGVGVLIITLTVLSFRQRRVQERSAGVTRVAGDPLPARGNPYEPVSPPSPWWPLVTLVWVCLQGAFGALTVTMKLFPAIVVMHLVGAVVLLALLCVQAARYAMVLGQRSQAVVSTGLRRLLLLATAMVGMQVLLGGWVSTNYAVLACTTFPTCQGSWWPPMNFSQGFEIWRPLGRLADGRYLDFAALTAIHYVHRLFAYAVFAILILLAVRLWRHPLLRKVAKAIGLLTLLQALTGLANVVLNWPLFAAVLHTGGAAALIVALVWALSVSRRDGKASVVRAPTASSSRGAQPQQFARASGLAGPDARIVRKAS